MLTRTQLEQYERDGIAYPIAVLTASDVQFFRSSFEKLELELGRNLEYLAMTHLYFGWSLGLALHPRILEPVEEILGPDVLVQATLILCKYPDDRSFVAWHQDVNYANQNSSPTVSAWVALGDSSRESGCMRVIPGSHKGGVLLHSDNVIENNLVNFSLAVDESNVMDVELKSGAMSLHQASIIHGSLPNNSDDKRIGFIIRFVTPRFRNSINPVVRARGTGAAEHLQLWTRPQGDDLQQNIAAWTEYLVQRNLWR